MMLVMVVTKGLSAAASSGLTTTLLSNHTK